MAGFEPARLSTSASKTDAPTNYATSARLSSSDLNRDLPDSKSDRNNLCYWTQPHQDLNLERQNRICCVANYTMGLYMSKSYSSRLDTYP